METDDNKGVERIPERSRLELRRLAVLTTFLGFIVLLLLGWQTRQPLTLGLLLGVIACLWIATRFTQKNNIALPLPWPLWIVGIGLVASFLFSTYNYASLWGLLQWIGLGMLLWVTLRISLSSHAALLSKTILGLGLVAAMLGFFDFFRMSDPSLGLAITFGWRNVFGGFLILLLPIFFFSAVGAPLRFSRTRWLHELAAIFLSANLVLTFSQGTWAVMILTLIAGLFLLRSQWSVKFFFRCARVLVLASLVVGLLRASHPWVQPTSALSSTSFQKKSTMESLSLRNRWDYAQSSWSMIQQTPLTGVGLGNFAVLYPQFQKNIWSFAADPHNFAIRLWAEGGIILLSGFLLFACWGFGFFRLTFRQSRRLHSPSQHAALLGWQLSIGASLLHAQMDTDYQVFALLSLVIIEIGWVLAQGHRLGVALRSPRLFRFSFSRMTAFPLMNVLGFFGFIALVASLTLSEYFVANAKVAIGMLQDRRAMVMSKRAIQFSPWNAQAYVVLSDATLSTIYGQPPSDEKERNRYRSLVFAQNARDLRPQHPGPHVQLAKIAQVSFAAEAEGFQTAINEGAEALRLDGWNFPQFYLTHAVNLHRRQQRTEAMAVLQTLIDRYTPEAMAKVFTVDRETMENQIAYAKELLDQYSTE